MKKFFLAILLVFTCWAGFAQTYNNEWIDYSKTYYKFKVGAKGLYHLTQPVLAAAGLSSTPAENFQLWHQGVEIPMYSSVASGVMGVNDYLEFYAITNDGAADAALYKADSLQMNKAWSLYTDTAAYFLTVNTGSNKRYINPGNDVASNALPPEPYFMYNLSRYYKTIMNSGYGIDLGEVVHSASYETAEGWSSINIQNGTNYTAQDAGLYMYSGGPSASLTVTVAGNTIISRPVTIKLNGTAVITGSVDGYGIKKLVNNNIPVSAFPGSNSNLEFDNGATQGDNIVIAGYEIYYPHLFNFGALSQFYFEMPAGPATYIEINNFNNGTGGAILMDTANNIKLNGVIAGGLVKFVLPAAAQTRKFVLLSTDNSQVKNITSLSTRNFVDYSNPVNQGDYLIISHSLLFDDGLGNNNVEAYRAYRSSTAGGNYQAKVVDIDQLTDQFAFGIKHHPLSIRNFSAYALANFSTPPKFIFMIGKGLNYNEFRNHESDPNTNKLALVPTFGFPSSDNLLTATRTGEYASIPTGRLSAINGTEVGYYLAKIQQFEQAQASTVQSIAGKGWMKNIAQITGGLTDPGLAALINSYMTNYQYIISDSLFGGSVYQFVKNTGLNTAQGTNKTIEQLFSEGLTMLNYFGHSSPNTIEFNLDNPENYNNTGKYPLVIVNGCNSGDLFSFDTLRAVSKGTLSEKFVFANQKGAIGYIASTHFGLPTELNYANAEFYSNMGKNMYGQPLGNIMQTTMQHVTTNYVSDYIAIATAEEITLHGDPAIRMNPHAKPDYVIQDSLVSFNPAVISVADNKLTITSTILNIGKAIRDSISIRVQQRLPDSSLVTLGNYRIKGVIYKDSIISVINLNPLIHKGKNQIIVTVDPDNEIPELSETNNSVVKNFTVIDDQIKPVWPYEYAIVDTANPVLYASTANPLAIPKQYVMEMDTTALFNSAFKISQTVTDAGGVIQFQPGIVLTDSTVYYWRVAVGPVTDSTNWQHSSFVYIDSSSDGFNFSHYYQYKNGSFGGINIDPVTRKFGFDDVTRRLLIRTGLYPYYSWDQINVNLDNDQLDYYGCNYAALQILVYDPITLQPMPNYNNAAGTSGRFGSLPVCSPVNGTRNFFEFSYADSSSRRKAAQFFDSIPTGYYVSVSNLGYSYGTNYFIDKWKADTVNTGPGKSLWHKLHELGFSQIDSFTKNLPFLFVYKKGDPIGFPIQQNMGPTDNTQIIQTYYIPGKKIEGTYSTPWVGPAWSWNNFKWDELVDSGSTTTGHFDIIGLDNGGNEIPIVTITDAKDTNISFINASYFPYLRVQMYNKDAAHAKTKQLKYLMLNADKVPEGAVAPNSRFMCKDTLMVSDTLHFGVMFRNVSNVGFDSLSVRLTITDQSGTPHPYMNLMNGAMLPPLNGGDSVWITYDIPMAGYFGQNQLVLEVNPDNAQFEQFHFNNYVYKNLVVLNPPPCPGTTTAFTAGMLVNEDSYQWQVDNGSGFVDLVNDTVYTGVKTNLLQLINAPTGLYGNKYRCVITNNGNQTYSNVFTLKFVSTWLGKVSTAWEDAGNWSCNELPDAQTDVIVQPGVTNFPVINSAAVCRSINIQNGTTVTVSSSNSLDIKGK